MLIPGVGFGGYNKTWRDRRKRTVVLKSANFSLNQVKKKEPNRHYVQSYFPV